MKKGSKSIVRKSTPFMNEVPDNSVKVNIYNEELQVYHLIVLFRYLLFYDIYGHMCSIKGVRRLQ